MKVIPKVEISNGQTMPAILIGTFQHTAYSQLNKVLRTGIEHGFTGFDTAHAYGNEAHLGKIINECIRDDSMQRNDFFITDKIDIWHMQQTNGDVSQKVEEALQLLNTPYLDLLLIHWPLPGYFVKTWETLIRVFEQGKAKAIGVSNVQIRHITQLVESTGFMPHVIQNERHPLHSDNEVFNYCKSNDIIFQAYSPVCRMVEPLSASMELNTIAGKYEKSVGQIILRWHIQTGSVPVFMTQKTERIKEYAAVFGFTLNRREIDIISALDINYKMTLESVVCPGF
jgi:diketogulonate reductase-like aldo/keto reductase